MSYLGTSVSILIAFICFLVADAIKNHTKLQHRQIPKIMGILGIVLSVVGYYFVPGYADTISSMYEVITYGLVSGLAATGFYELGKAFRGEEQSGDITPAIDETYYYDEDSTETVMGCSLTEKANILKDDQE